MARSFAESKKGETPPREDVFVERVLQATEWARDNLRTVIAAAVILALGAGAILYYRGYRETVREQAAVELQDLGSALNALDPAVARDRLQGFVSRYEGTVAADEARILLARLHLQAARPEAAIEALQPAAERGADTPIGYAALSLQAAAHEAMGEVESALRIYDRLGREARLPFQRRRALADRARVLVRTGRYAEAAALYEDLAARAEEAEATDEAALYRLRLGEARGLAAAEAPPPAAGSGSAVGPAPLEPGPNAAADTASAG